MKYLALSLCLACLLSAVLVSGRAFTAGKSGDVGKLWSNCGEFVVRALAADGVLYYC